MALVRADGRVKILRRRFRLQLDVMKRAVQMSVNPEVIETPVISAVAKDQTSSKQSHASPYVPTSIGLSSGAGEPTIIARSARGS